MSKIPDEDDIARLLNLLQEKDNRKKTLIEEAWKNTPPDKRTPIWLETLLMNAGIGVSKRFLAVASLFGEEEARKLYPGVAREGDTFPGGIELAQNAANIDYKLDKLIDERIRLLRLKSLEKIWGEEEEDKKPKTKKIILPVMDNKGQVSFQPLEVDGDVDATSLMMMMWMMAQNRNNGDSKKDEELERLKQELYEMRIKILEKELELKNQLIKERLEPIMKRANMGPKDYINELKEYVELAREIGMIDRGLDKDELERRERREMFNEGMKLLKEALEQIGKPISTAVGEGLKEGIKRKMEIETAIKMMGGGNGGTQKGTKGKRRPSGEGTN